MNMTPIEKERIRRDILEKYRQVAQSPEGRFRFPTGRAGLRGLGYDPHFTERLPDAVAAFFCGVGNPFAMGPVRPGEHVLDVGCGAGVDTCIAAMMAGEQGLAFGVDGSPEMLARARDNAALAGLGNVGFKQADAESLPFAEASFDVLISNGVYNLVLDKPRALAEAYRVLKPGGRVQIADQMLLGPPPDPAEAALNWFK